MNYMTFDNVAKAYNTSDLFRKSPFINLGGTPIREQTNVSLGQVYGAPLEQGAVPSFNAPQFFQPEAPETQLPTTGMTNTDEYLEESGLWAKFRDIYNNSDIWMPTAREGGGALEEGDYYERSGGDKWIWSVALNTWLQLTLSYGDDGSNSWSINPTNQPFVGGDVLGALQGAGYVDENGVGDVVEYLQVGEQTAPELGNLGLYTFGDNYYEDFIAVAELQSSELYDDQFWVGMRQASFNLTNYGYDFSEAYASGDPTEYLREQWESNYNSEAQAIYEKYNNPVSRDTAMKALNEEYDQKWKDLHEHYTTWYGNSIKLASYLIELGILQSGAINNVTSEDELLELIAHSGPSLDQINRILAEWIEENAQGGVIGYGYMSKEDLQAQIDKNTLEGPKLGLQENYNRLDEITPWQSQLGTLAKALETGEIAVLDGNGMLDTTALRNSDNIWGAWYADVIEKSYDTGVLGEFWQINADGDMVLSDDMNAVMEHYEEVVGKDQTQFLKDLRLNAVQSGKSIRDPFFSDALTDYVTSQSGTVADNLGQLIMREMEDQYTYITNSFKDILREAGYATQAEMLQDDMAIYWEQVRTKYEMGLAELAQEVAETNAQRQGELLTTAFGFLANFAGAFI